MSDALRLTSLFSLHDDYIQIQIECNDFYKWIGMIEKVRPFIIDWDYVDGRRCLYYILLPEDYKQIKELYIKKKKELFIKYLYKPKLYKLVKSFECEEVMDVLYHPDNYLTKDKTEQVQLKHNACLVSFRQLLKQRQNRTISIET